MSDFNLNTTIKKVTVRDLPISSKFKKKNRLTKKTCIYVFFSDEDVLSLIKTRYSRPHKAVKTHFMTEILMLAQLPTDTKMSWSQRAGCSCGCSPGFVINDERVSRGKEIYVNI